MPKRSTMILLAFMLTSGMLVVATTSAGAAAARYRVHVDTTADDPALAFNRYFPNAISVHRGDMVDFSWDGLGTPHTVTAVPDADGEAWRFANVFTPGAPFEDPILDTAVGGDDGDLIENPAVANPSDPSCGSSATPCTFNGSSVVNSGIQFPFPGNVPKFSVKVTAPVGSYSFLCLLHPGMSMPLRVASYATQLPDPAQVEARAQRQIRTATAVDGSAAFAQSQQVIQRPIGQERERFTMFAGGFQNQVSANLFPAEPIDVQRGDRIKFLGTGEIHTATVPISAAGEIPFISTFCEVPGPDIPASSPFDCASPADFQLVLDPRAINPTASRALADPDRFVNTGLMFTGVNGAFVARRVGTYGFVCLVHGPSMSGTIVVHA